MRNTILIMIFLFVFTNLTLIFAEDEDGFGLTATSGISIGSGSFGLAVERSFNNRSIIIQLQFWNIWYPLPAPASDGSVEIEYWRTYFAGGYRQYLSDSNSGPYLQALFESGMPIELEDSDNNVYNISTTQEGLLLSFGFKEIVGNRMILDFGMGFPVEIDWPVTHTIANDYLPIITLGIGVQL